MSYDEADQRHDDTLAVAATDLWRCW